MAIPALKNILKECSFILKYASGFVLCINDSSIQSISAVKHPVSGGNVFSQSGTRKRSAFLQVCAASIPLCKTRKFAKPEIARASAVFSLDEVY